MYFLLVTSLASLMENLFASVAVMAICQYGSPNLRESSSPTHIESSFGSIMVMPLDTCFLTASTTGLGEWPNMEPVSPRQRSRYRFPSTSLMHEPFASVTNTG